MPDWLRLYLENEIKVSCQFGDHLLSLYPTNPIALVKAPKTAILGTLYFGFPDNPKNFLWLAVYNISSLNIEKCKILQGRKIVLFPDLNAYENWNNKAKKFQKLMPGTTFKVSDLIENLAPNENKKEGEDIADFLTRIDWKEFRNIEPEPIKPEPLVAEKIKINEEVIFDQPDIWKHEPLPPAERIKVYEAERNTPLTWGNEINELEKFFLSISLPALTVKLNAYSTIESVSMYIESHFATSKANDGNKTFLPFLDRLQSLKRLLITNQN